MISTLQSNQASVDEYADDIKSNLASASKSWMLVARKFAEAETVFEKFKFNQLLEQTRFDYSTVCRLIKITKSKRLMQYEEKLVLIDAWSTLHKLTTLDDKKFAEFANIYLENDEPMYFTRADVDNPHRIKPAREA